MHHQIGLEIFGTTLIIRSKNAECIRMLELEFNFFIKTLTKSDYNILLELSEIPSGLMPKLFTKKISQNSLTYDEGTVRWNDYFGKALSYLNYDNGEAAVYSPNQDLLHEIAYLLVLSLSSKQMDQRGFHKIHACAFHHLQKNFILSLPSKGGKTTLFLEFCQYEGVELISDDTPVIDSNGKVYSFPLRVGVENIPSWLDKKNYPVFKREKFSDKYLIPLNELGRPIYRGSSEQNIYIIGLRSNGEFPQLVKASSLQGLKALFEHMIIGIGLPMVVEYFVKNSISDWCVLLKIFIKRFFAALAFWKKSRVYYFVMSTDPKLNADFLIRNSLDL